MSFKIAASFAFNECIRKRRSCPSRTGLWQSRSVSPDEYLGDCIGDINARRGAIHGVENRGALHTIKVSAPLSQLFGYATALRSLTQGRATYTMRVRTLRHYPGHVGREDSREGSRVKTGIWLANNDRSRRLVKDSETGGLADGQSKVRAEQAPRQRRDDRARRSHGKTTLTAAITSVLAKAGLAGAATSILSMLAPEKRTWYHDRYRARGIPDGKAPLRHTWIAQRPR